MARIVVVLPAPFGPRNPKTWPEGTSNDSPSSAMTDPYWRRKAVNLKLDRSHG
jgi:hypothetical protein